VVAMPARWQGVTGVTLLIIRHLGCYKGRYRGVTCNAPLWSILALLGGLDPAENYFYCASG
jgi:hypothetical protein